MRHHSSLCLFFLLSLACAGVPEHDAPPPTTTTTTTVPPVGGGGSDPVGEWVEALEFPMMTYEDAGTCAGDGGTWTPEVGCFFAGENRARISPATGDSWPLSVEIVTTNAHTCSFEGALRREGDALVAHASGEVYVPGEGGAEGTFVPGPCTVTIRIVDEVLGLESEGDACSTFCGARAHLSMGGARRTSP